MISKTPLQNEIPNLNLQHNGDRETRGLNDFSGGDGDGEGDDADEPIIDEGEADPVPIVQRRQTSSGVKRWLDGGIKSESDGGDPPIVSSNGIVILFSILNRFSPAWITPS